jgi:hypothetical protein
MGYGGMGHGGMGYGGMGMGMGMGYGGMGGLVGGMGGGPQAWMSEMQTQVQSVGRISGLLQMSFQAIHFGFMSVMQLLQGTSHLFHESQGGFDSFSDTANVQYAYLIMRFRLMRWVDKHRSRLPASLTSLVPSFVAHAAHQQEGEQRMLFLERRDGEVTRACNYLPLQEVEKRYGWLGLWLGLWLSYMSMKRLLFAIFRFFMRAPSRDASALLHGTPPHVCACM